LHLGWARSVLLKEEEEEEEERWDVMN